MGPCWKPLLNGSFVPCNVSSDQEKQKVSKKIKHIGFHVNSPHPLLLLTSNSQAKIINQLGEFFPMIRTPRAVSPPKRVWRVKGARTNPGKKGGNSQAWMDACCEREYSPPVRNFHLAIKFLQLKHPIHNQILLLRVDESATGPRCFTSDLYSTVSSFFLTKDFF